MGEPRFCFSINSAVYDVMLSLCKSNFSEFKLAFSSGCRCDMMEVKKQKVCFMNFSSEGKDQNYLSCRMMERKKFCSSCLESLAYLHVASDVSFPPVQQAQAAKQHSDGNVSHDVASSLSSTVMTQGNSHPTRFTHSGMRKTKG